MERFLWRYIEKYHRRDLDTTCGASGVKYTYRGNVSQLVLESTDGSALRQAGERVASICQRLAADVVDVSFPRPDGVDRQVLEELAGGLAVFYVDRKQMCHVIGPRDSATSTAREIQAACRDDHNAVVAGRASTSKTTGFRTVTPGGVSVEVSAGQL